MARRMKGEGSVHPRGDGMWVGQVELGWVDGKRKRRTVYAKTQEACVRKVAQAKRERDAGLLQSRSKTVETWLREWLDITAAKVKPRTLLTYRSYVERHLIRALGKKKLDKLEPHHVREMHAAVLDGHSSTTALHAHRILSTALERARKDGLVMRNVATLVDPPARDVSKRRGLTSAQAKAILTTAGPDSRWWASFLTGARQGELLGLRWAYVDLDLEVADLAWSLQRVPYSHGCGRTKDGWTCGREWGARCPDRAVSVPAGMEHEHLEANICLLRPKTKGSRRRVPLLPFHADMLRALRDSDPAPNPHGLVWHRPDGKPWDAAQDWRAWKALLERAKVPGVTLHEARNTTATLLLEAGVDPHIISAILGHSDVVMTRSYQSVSLDVARKAVGQLGAALT